jgi:hypothetical protein
MTYRRSVAVESLDSQQIPSSPANQARSLADIEQEDFYPPVTAARKRKRPGDDDYYLTLFRRVRIKTSIFLPAKDSRPGSPAVELSGTMDDDEHNAVYQYIWIWSCVSSSVFAIQYC